MIVCFLKSVIIVAGPISISFFYTNVFKHVIIKITLEKSVFCFIDLWFVSFSEMQSSQQSLALSQVYSPE